MGRALVVQEEGPDPDVISDATGLEPSQTDWLWEGYMLKGKVTNIEARGGAGKSRLVLAIAACGSIGCFPFGPHGEPIRFEPWSTLYLSSEDDPAEIADTFEECGGDRKYLKIYDPREHGPLTIHGEGEDRLIRMIQKNGVKNVVADPVLEFAPAYLKSQSDNVAITQFMAGLRRVGAKTESAVTIMRHFAKGMIGKEMHELAAGGEAWRNGARGQFVLFSHPENRIGWTQILVCPARNTMRVQYAKPFGIEIDSGRQFFLTPEQVDMEKYMEHYDVLKRRYGGPQANLPRGTRGPGNEALEKTAQAILDYLYKNGATYTKAVRTDLIAAGFVQATIYRAKDALIAKGLIVDDRGTWSIGDTYDPFDDAPLQEDTHKAWFAGLD